MLQDRRISQYPKKKVCPSGFSLLELIVAIIILAIVATGSLHYHFYATQQIRTTKAEQTAMRTAQLLLEDWKSNGGNENYDPEELQLGFVAVEKDRYTVTIDELPMSVNLLWSDLDTDPVTNVTLRKIQALIRWRRDYSQSAIQSNDPVYAMTTYVRLDQAGG